MTRMLNRRLLASAAVALLAAASAFGAAQRLTVKVTKTSSDPISGYWVEYTINGMKYRSDQTGWKINTIAWEGMNDADREKTIKAVYGVYDARKLQFGSATAQDMGDWFDFKKGWKHGKQILTDKLTEKDYPGLVRRFSDGDYWVNSFKPRCSTATIVNGELGHYMGDSPDAPELQSLIKLNVHYFKLAQSAYEALQKAEYIRTAAAVKSTAGDLIKLIVDKCLVPAISPGISGGIGLFSKPDAAGAALDWFGGLVNWQGSLEDAVLGKRANATDAMKVIKMMDSAIAASYKLIKECTTKAHELQNEADDRNDEWVAAYEARKSMEEKDALVLRYREWKARSYPIEDAGKPTQAIADRVKSLKEELDARYREYFRLQGMHTPEEAAAKAAYEAAEKAYNDYINGQLASCNARAKAWKSKYDARLNELRNKLSNPGEPTYPRDGTVWNNGKLYSAMEYFTATESDVAKAIEELKSYADKMEEYHNVRHDVGEAALDLADEVLKESLPIYNDYLAIKDNPRVRPSDVCGELNVLGYWRPDFIVDGNDLFWYADPAFMRDVRAARCYIRLCENYATALAARQRFDAAQEAFRTRISKGVIASKNAYNAANAAYTAAMTNVPNYVKEQEFVSLGVNGSGYYTIGSYLNTRSDTQLHRDFIANSGSASLASTYRTDLNKGMDAYNAKLNLRSDANGERFYYENMEKRYRANGYYGSTSYYPPSQDVTQSSEINKLRELQQDFNGQPCSHCSSLIAYGELNRYQEDFVKNYDNESGWGSDAQRSRIYWASYDYSQSTKPQFKGNAAPSGDGAKPSKTAAPSTLNDTMGIGSYAYHAVNYYESMDMPVKNPHKTLVQPLLDETWEIRMLVKSGKADPTWQLKLYKNDGTGVSTNFVCVYGIPRRMPTADDLMWAKPGYKLKGWGIYSNATVVAAAAESFVTNTVARNGKKTYYAMWELANEKYSLFCEPMGGKLVGGNFGDANGTAKTAQLHVTVGKSDYWALGTASRAGYKFLGWYDEEEGGRKVFDVGGKCVKNGTYWDANGNWKFEGRVRVYAHWSLDPNAYLVRFHKNDGTGLTREVAFIYGTAKALPTCANGLGWTSAGLFKGWATSRVNAAKGIVWKGDAATVSTAAAKGKTLNVYAVWEKAYNIRFHKQDGTGATYVRKYTSGYKSPLPKYSASLGWARRGFKFKGWATSASAAKVWKADGAYVSAATTAGKTLDVYAVWELDPNYYCIYFIRNDGAGTWRKVAYLPGTQYWLPSLSGGLGWARRGYTFKGWATSTANARAGKVWKGDAAKFKDAAAKGKTLTVYAIWQLTAGYYQIAFHKNDGTGKWRSLGYQYGKSTKLPTCVNGLGWGRSGYVFKGWATSEANAKAGKIWKADGAWVSTAAAKGKTLNVYAVWAKGKASAKGLAAPCGDGAPAADASIPSPAFNAWTAGCGAAEDMADVATFVGPLADGTGVYVLSLCVDGRGIFSVEAEGCSFTASCEAVRRDDYIVVTLDDGTVIVISSDGSATQL